MINNIESIHPSTPRSTQKTGESALNQESFLKLLLTQLKQQDPLSPFDSNTMMQQMSELTSLSSAQELQQAVGKLSDNMGTSQVFAASQMVGKNVQLLSEQALLEPGKALQAQVFAPAEATSVNVEIRDQFEHVVKTMQLPGTGTLDMNWDGLDAQGNKVASGFYKLSATATLNNESVRLPTASNFTIGSVAMDKKGHGGVVMNVEGLGGFYMDDIIKIL